MKILIQNIAHSGIVLLFFVVCSLKKKKVLFCEYRNEKKTTEVILVLVR